MPVYKVSIVVAGSDHPGAILNMSHPPKIGEKIRLGTREFQVVEVLKLLPPRGDFQYIHATCRAVEDP